MNEAEARKLGRAVAQQSNGVRVKFGRTNGQATLHLINEPLRQSRTIYSEPEWSEHPWNVQNQSKKEDA